MMKDAIDNLLQSVSQNCKVWPREKLPQINEQQKQFNGNKVWREAPLHCFTSKIAKQLIAKS